MYILNIDMKKILAILIAVFFLSGQHMQAGDKEWW